MAFCPTCGTKNGDHQIACTTCGAVLPGLEPPPMQQQSPHRGGRTMDPSLGYAPDSALMSPADTNLIGAGPLERARNEPWPSTAQQRQPPSPGYPAPAQARPPQVAPHASARSHGRLIGRVKLVVEQGKILGEQFLLGDPDMMVGRYDAASGRCPDIDLTAQDPAYVHRQHVRFTFDPSGEVLTMHDMGGRNGCYLNNMMLEKQASLRVNPGDKIRIGRVVMRLQLAPEATDDGAPRPR